MGVICSTGLLAQGQTAGKTNTPSLPLILVQTVVLPGITGDFDHFAIDVKGKRLFLAGEDHKTVEVIDLDKIREFAA